MWCVLSDISQMAAVEVVGGMWEVVEELMYVWMRSAVRHQETVATWQVFYCYCYFIFLHNEDVNGGSLGPTEQRRGFVLQARGKHLLL